MMSEIDLKDAPSLIDRWQVLRQEAPGVRARDAAARLGVSEAELVACRPAPQTRRLNIGGRDLVLAVQALGTVMALTRNDWAVHEKTGAYDNISGNEAVGLVVNGAIDLRMFFSQWVHVFACEEPARSGTRRSIQVFDATGTAVHKIWLTEHSDGAAYERLVARHETQNRPVKVSLPEPEEPVEESDVEGLESAWRSMTDSHQFHGLLKSRGLARTRAFRIVADDLARQVDNRAVIGVLEGAAAKDVPVMVFVGNRGCIQIHGGPVRRLMTSGPWFNVLDPGFNLHLRLDGIAETWVVRKPTGDGTVTSLELLDEGGEVIAYLFGARREGDPERAGWRDVIAAVEDEASLT